MSTSKLGFLLFSITTLIFDIAFFLVFFRSKSQYKKYIFQNIILSILIIPVYLLYIFTDNTISAYIYHSIMNILVDLMSFFFLNFTHIYIYYLKQTIRQKLNIVLLSTILFDLILNVTNIFTNSIYELTLIETSVGQMWSIQNHFFEYVHHFFVLCLSLSVFTAFLVAYVRNPIQYKARYVGILIGFLIIVFSNAVCFATNFPFNISILIYGVFYEFVFYYANYVIQHHLLIQSLKNLNSTVDDGIIYFDNHGKIVYINNSAEDLFITNNVFSIETLEKFRLEKVTELKDEIDNVKLTWNQDFNVYDDVRHIYFEYEDVIYDNANIGSYLLITDKTDEVNKFKKEKYISSHDNLTGLYNRDSFYDVVDEVIKTEPDVSRYMILANIKDFKLINELFGQEMGNKVLVKEAEIFRQIFNEKTTVIGRLGDDKFGIFVEKIHFHEQMILSGTEQLKSIFDNNYTQIVLAFGIAEMINLNETAKGLIDKARIAIEVGKQNYQSTFFYYDSSVMEKILSEKNIINEFQNAITGYQIQIDLQPIVDNEGKILGAEALSRWYNPTRGLLHPNKFIPILENNSLIQNLDLYVWETVFKQIAEWNKNGLNVPFISINISDKDVYYLDLYSVLTKLVLQYGISPKSIVLEFKESAIIYNVNRISQLFSNLREFGFKIALDNYGRGYSSLNFLKDVQIDFIKIDMVFLIETEVFDRSKIILDFLSKMAESLNISVIFEGVETLDHVKAVKKLGDIAMQGYYFSHSISIQEFENKFSSHAKFN